MNRSIPNYLSGLDKEEISPQADRQLTIEDQLESESGHLNCGLIKDL
jgi:hypothetical protein